MNLFNYRLFATEDTEFTERRKETAQASRILLLLLTFVFFANSALASPCFTKPESAALLEYAKACLLAQIDGRPAPVPPEFVTRIQRPCFVTFFVNKRVFACFGGFTPRKSNLADEIAENVRMALKNDARSRSISREKVLNAGVQVTFPLGQPQRVNDYSSIDPVSEGMFVESANSGVAFVPGEAKTANWAFREALRRLGEKDSTGVTVYRFKAEAVSARRLSPSPQPSPTKGEGVKAADSSPPSLYGRGLGGG